MTGRHQLWRVVRFESNRVDATISPTSFRSYSPDIDQFSSVVHSFSKLNFVLVHTNPKRLREDSVTWFDFYRRNDILTYQDELSFTCVRLRIVSLLFYTFKSYLILSSPHFLKVRLRCLCLADWRFGRTILNNFGPMVSLPLSPLEIWELGWKERSQKEDCLDDLRGTSSWILQIEETEGAGGGGGFTSFLYSMLNLKSLLLSHSYWDWNYLSSIIINSTGHTNWFHFW